MLALLWPIPLPFLTPFRYNTRSGGVSRGWTSPVLAFGEGLHLDCWDAIRGCRWSATLSWCGCGSACCGVTRRGRGRGKARRRRRGRRGAAGFGGRQLGTGCLELLVVGLLLPLELLTCE